MNTVNILEKIEESDIIDGKLVIPDGIEKIAEGVGMLMPEIKEIVLPKSLREIDDLAFAGCENLTKVKLPIGAIEKIGCYCFDQTNIKYINHYNVASVNKFCFANNYNFFCLFKQELETKECFLDTGLDEIATKGYVEIHKEGLVIRYNSPDVFIKCVELGGNNTINTILSDTYLERLEKHRAENKYRAYLEEQMSK